MAGAGSTGGSKSGVAPCEVRALAEYAGEYQFFLGLQMGLELGALDLLGAEEEETLSHARALSCS